MKMCVKCHQGFSDDEVASQLIDEGDYSGWNEVSISHICLAYIGANGKLAQQRATQLLDNYVIWKRNNPKEGDGSFFGEPSIEFVQQMRHQAEQTKQRLHSEGIFETDDIKHKLFGGPEETPQVTYRVEPVSSYEQRRTMVPTSDGCRIA